MKSTIIQFSELGNRWDAGFHIFRKQYEGAAEGYAAAMTKDEAITTVMDAETFDLSDYAILKPLLRGSFSGTKRDDYAKAVREYPFLAMAAMADRLDEVLAAKKAELERKSQALERIAAVLSRRPAQPNSKPAAPTLVEAALDTLGASDFLPRDVKPLTPERAAEVAKLRFARGVVYDCEGTYVVPVEDSATYWLADCWQVEADEWEGERTIGDLVADGEVPTPYLMRDLGKPLGCIDLPDHSANYEVGWR